MITAIYASLLLDGSRAEPLKDPVVLIENGRIAGIHQAPGPELGPEAVRIDLTGLVLYPGLIDAHAHLTLDAGRPGWTGRMADPAAEQVLRAMENMAVDLAAGVTTLRSPGDREEVDLSIKRALAQGPLTGPRLYTAGRGIRATHGHGLIGYPIDSAEGVRAAVRENLAGGADFIKLFMTGTVLAPEIHCYPSREALSVAVEEAHRVGKPVAVHCIGGPGFDLGLELGIDIFEHGYFLDDRQLEALVKSGRWLVVTPSPHLAEEWVAHVPRELAEGFRAGREKVAERLAVMVRSGVRYVIGSDGLHGRLAHDVRLVIEAGATPAEALAAVGPRSAEMIGLADECGRLAPGLAADLIALPGNPLEDPSHLGRVEAVIRAGRVVKGRTA